MDIMQAILDIEQKAQESLKAVEKLEQEQNDGLTEELKRLENAAQEEVRQTLEQVKNRCMEEQKDALDAAERETRSRLETLQAQYEQNKEKWVSQMTKNILENTHQ